jgi:putative ribosome biogenesis GTPase RsgA
VKQALDDGKIPEERYRNYLNILEDCKAGKKEMYD